MNLARNGLLLLTAFCLLPSCRIAHTYYSPANHSWKKTQLPDAASLKYQVFLIGDAGNAKTDGSDPVLGLLRSKLEKAGANSAVIYLGDNIYNSGLPDSADPERADAVRKINAQLVILKNFKGKPFFIPGNHDWGYSLHEAHSARVVREKEYVEKFLGRNGIFIPENGCPGPVAVPLTDDLTFIAIDPDWLLEDGDRIGTTCDIKTAGDFEKKLADDISAAKGKNIIVAAHQPLFSTGPHSGYEGWKPHIFPLTDIKPKLYIPLPVIGSIYVLARVSGGSIQDLHNKHYRKYINTVLSAAKGTPNVVMAAGHEHTLEYFEHNKDLHEVLSGAGSKKSNIRKTTKLGFGAHTNGFSVINYYNNGEVWVEYWEPLKGSPEGTLLFRTKMYNKQ